MRLNYQKTIARLPQEQNIDILSQIQQMRTELNQTIVVLDDDPTGCQTVYDIPVLTEWNKEILLNEFLAETPLFYILTNSRALQPEQAALLNREIAEHLQAASDKSGRQFCVISRSDSTLRGHYPQETDALQTTLDLSHAITVICPFFLEGGRLTIDDVHYVLTGDELFSADETPFAQDASFGFSTAHLPTWIEEKTDGCIKSLDVACISLDEIRIAGSEAISKKLSSLPQGSVCVINSVTMHDMETVCYALQLAEKNGKAFIYRTAASFVRAFAGLPEKPLLSKSDLISTHSNGGLIVVGSYVPKTTSQLDYLLQHANVETVEISAEKLIGNERDTEIQRNVSTVDDFIAAGRHVVLYTSRQLITGSDAASSLEIVTRVSSGVVQCVRNLNQQPAFVIAKGGITSSDVATKGLGVKRAHVLGQILPGIPVWKLGAETKHPGLNYVVFPGNVGEEDALLKALLKCSSPALQF